MSNLEILLEHLKPWGIEAALESALEEIGSSMAEYRQEIRAVTSRLVDAGFVVVPRMEGAEEERSRIFIQHAEELMPHQVLILPYYADFSPEVSNLASLSKKGVLLTTPRYYSLIKRPGSSVHELLWTRLRKEVLADSYWGIDFQGTTNDRRYRVLTLFNCVRAGIAKDVLPKGAVKVDHYVSKVSEEALLELGGEATAAVPSFSKRRRWKVALHHIPVYRGEAGPEQKRISFDFYGEDDCGKKVFFNSKYRRHIRALFGRVERRGDEVDLDHHVILAYWCAKEAIEADTPYRALPIFPEPSERTKNFFRKLNTRVFIETTDGTHLRRVPLGAAYPLMEKALHKMVAYNNEKRSAEEPSKEE